MVSILYVLWFLLPLTLFLMAGWGLVKPHFNVHGKEHIGPYFQQGVFCLIGLAIAIAIDKASWFEPMVESLGMGLVNIMVVRWLLYPSVLVALASVQKRLYKEHKKRVAPSRSHY